MQAAHWNLKLQLAAQPMPVPDIQLDTGATAALLQATPKEDAMIVDIMFVGELFFEEMDFQTLEEARVWAEAAGYGPYRIFDDDDHVIAEGDGSE